MCCVVFNDTATTEIYTLSLHDALPIYSIAISGGLTSSIDDTNSCGKGVMGYDYQVVGTTSDENYYMFQIRSEEHTSELQSRQYLVCRLMLEKKKRHVLHVYQ